MNRGNLIVIAKECLPGQAKTRLTPPLTPEQAAAVAYQSLVLTIRQAVRVNDVTRILYFQGDPDSLLADIPDLYDQFHVIPQVTGELDERLGHIFDTVGRSRTVLIGMDTPQIDPKTIENIFDEVGSEDGTRAWLGLTDDGGYWLIGMEQPNGDAIRGVPMSKLNTGAAQLGRLRELGYAVTRLPQLQDMDYWADAQAIAPLVPTSTFADLVRQLTLLPVS